MNKFVLMNEAAMDGAEAGGAAPAPAPESAEPSSLLNAAPEAAATAAQGPAVERPEWLLDKYMTDDRDVTSAIAEQARAYTELQKQFGGFTGAPEEYNFELPEGVEGSIDTEMDAYKQFTELARNANMSQETAQQLFNIFVGYQDSMTQQFQVDFNSEKEKLGPQADKRIGAVAQWASANLAAEDMPVLETMVMTADQITVLEKLIGKTRNSQIPKTNEVDSPITGYTKHQFDQDVNSERYRTDRAFRDEVRKKAASLFPGT